jgi:hypothetical protein
MRHGNASNMACSFQHQQDEKQRDVTYYQSLFPTPAQQKVQERNVCVVIHETYTSTQEQEG